MNMNKLSLKLFDEPIKRIEEIAKEIESETDCKVRVAVQVQVRGGKTPAEQRFFDYGFNNLLDPLISQIRKKARNNTAAQVSRAKTLSQLLETLQKMNIGGNKHDNI